jgi:hypothetical protein
MVLLVVVRGVKAWALAMERASGLEEDITMQTGIFVNRVVGRTPTKKANDLVHGHE